MELKALTPRATLEPLSLGEVELSSDMGLGSKHLQTSPHAVEMFKNFLMPTEE